MPDIYEACRLNSNQKLGRSRARSRRGYGWHDIVLPAQPSRSSCARSATTSSIATRCSATGGSTASSHGKGVSALFAGPSGTGKTMAAEIIAGELALDLYKIDLSTVVSKFIGETEKNLRASSPRPRPRTPSCSSTKPTRCSASAARSKDSHDRYANIEVGYLLQRIEEYDGVVILATNFRQNMDEAFVRRLQFIDGVPVPHGSGPAPHLGCASGRQQAPRIPTIDFELLARALQDHGRQHPQHGAGRPRSSPPRRRRRDHGASVAATQRELQKMGKIVADGEFDPLRERSRDRGRSVLRTRTVCRRHVAGVRGRG